MLDFCNESHSPAEQDAYCLVSKLGFCNYIMHCFKLFILMGCSHFVDESTGMYRFDLPTIRSEICHPGFCHPIWDSDEVRAIESDILKWEKASATSQTQAQIDNLERVVGNVIRPVQQCVFANHNLLYANLRRLNNFQPSHDEDVITYNEHIEDRQPPQQVIEKVVRVKAVVQASMKIGVYAMISLGVCSTVEQVWNDYSKPGNKDKSFREMERKKDTSYRKRDTKKGLNAVGKSFNERKPLFIEMERLLNVFDENEELAIVHLDNFYQSFRKAFKEKKPRALSGWREFCCLLKFYHFSNNYTTEYGRTTSFKWKGKEEILTMMHDIPYNYVT